MGVGYSLKELKMNKQDRKLLFYTIFDSYPGVDYLNNPWVYSIGGNKSSTVYPHDGIYMCHQLVSKHKDLVESLNKYSNEFL